MEYYTFVKQHILLLIISLSRKGGLIIYNMITLSVINVLFHSKTEYIIVCLNAVFLPADSWLIYYQFIKHPIWCMILKHNVTFKIDHPCPEFCHPSGNIHNTKCCFIKRRVLTEAKQNKTAPAHTSFTASAWQFHSHLPMSWFANTVCGLMGLLKGQVAWSC